MKIMQQRNYNKLESRIPLNVFDDISFSLIFLQKLKVSESNLIKQLFQLNVQTSTKSSLAPAPTRGGADGATSPNVFGFVFKSFSKHHISKY